MSESDPRAVEERTAAWPASPTAFADTSRCPACFTVITGARCTACGLDLRMPRLAEALENGRAIQRLVSERADLIRTARADQVAAERRAQEAEAEQRARSGAREAAERAALVRAKAERDREAARQVHAIPPSHEATAVAAASAAETTAAPPPAEAAAARRPLAHRFSMQFTILGVGVILTSVGAIVFLFWAYLVVGLEVRSMIIAGASAGVLVLAWYLRRRGLILTGEGVGVVAIVLLMLDAWIVRANHAFGTGAIGELAYYGGSALILAGVLVIARRLTSLRVTGYAAAGLAPIGIAMLAASSVPDEGSTRWWVAGLAALALGAVGVRVLPRSRPAWVFVAFSGAIGLAAVGGAFDALPHVRGHALIAFGAAAVLWAALAWASRDRVAGDLRSLAAAIAAISAAGAPVVAAVQELSSDDAGWVAPVGAGVVASTIALAWGLQARRARTEPAIPAEDAASSDGDPAPAVADAASQVEPDAGASEPSGATGRRTERAPLRTAMFAAAVVAAVAALPGLGFGLVRLVFGFAAGMSGWDAAAPQFSGFSGAGAVWAPVAVAAVAASVLAALGRLRSLPVLPVAALAWAAIVASTFAPPGWAVVAYAAVAVASLALGVVARGRQLVVLSTATEGSAAVMLIALGASQAPVWPAATGVVLAVAVAGFLTARRTWQASRSARASRIAHVAAASALACVSAGLIPAWTATVGARLPDAWTSPWMWVGLGAAASLAVVVACRRLPVAETWGASAPALAASLAALAGLVASPSPSAWVPALALAIVAGAGVALDPRIALRTSLAALVAPAAADAAWNIVPLLAIDRGYRWVAVAAVLLVLAGAGLLIRLPRGASTALAWFVSLGAVGVVAVAGAAPTEQAWLVLLLVAPIPYLAAAVTGEPTAGRSPWRHVAWLSPVIGLAALWTALGLSGATLVEAYTLPAAAVLLGMAVLLAIRRTRSESGPAPAAGRVALAWTGAATAVVPTVAASADPALRPILAVCAGAILLALAPWCTPQWRAIPVRTVVIAAGGAAVAGAAVVRGTALGMRGDWSADVWALVALAGGLAAAFLLDRAIAAHRPSPILGTVPGGVAAAAIAAASLPALALVIHPSLPMWLLLAPVVVLGVVHAATAVPRLRPLSHPVARWTALVVLAVVAAATVVLSGIDPFDPVTALVGVSLLVAGIVGRRPGLAWAGAAAGLIPSIAASSQPALRPLVLVGIGIVLLIAAPWIPRALRTVPLRTIALASAAAALIGASGMRGLAVAAWPEIARDEMWGPLPWAADLWGAVALAGGLVAAVLLTRITEAPVFVPPWVAASAVAVAVMPATVLAARGGQPTPLLLAPIVVFAALRVVVSIPRATLSHPLVAATAALASLVLGAVTLIFERIDPFDIVTVLTGVSLLAGGVLAGRRFAVWSGAAIALLPSVVASGGSALRPVIVVGVGLLLAIALPWIPRAFRAVPVRLVTAVCAVVAITGAATVRALSLAFAPYETVEILPGVRAAGYVGVELWWAIALVAGLATVIVWLHADDTHPRVAEWLAASVVAVSLIPVALIADADRPVAYAIAPVVGLAVVHVASTLPWMRPLGRALVWWTILAALAVIGALTLIGDIVDPFDLVTATVGVAMVAAGLIRMRRTPALRSWPALGPGLAVLLVPSLLADYADTATWRLVALGVVALATMLFGILRRLQAPFLIGAVVLVVHGITQLWPVIARNYGQVWWWLWLAIAGVILIAIAATYERQLRFAKRMIRTVASLR